MFPTRLLKDSESYYTDMAVESDVYFYYSPTYSFSSHDSSGSDHSSLLTYPSYSSFSSPASELHELASCFQSITIDVEGMERELVDVGKRDTDQIRQDFIRNGIDSSIHGSGVSVRGTPPGFGAPVSSVKWPLTSMENQSTPTLCSAPSSEIYSSDEPSPENKDIKRSSRRRRFPKENDDYCVFCYNNGENQETYLSHACRDEKGFVMCPRLRKYVCPYCKATDRYAHTKKYCPRKPIITPADLEKMVLDGVLPPNGHASRGKRALRF